MTNRRDLIKAGLIGVALPLATTGAGHAATAAPPGGVQREGAPRGDVTDVWFHDLAPRWKQGPAAVAGVTAHNSLFVLERLAWDAGLRVTARAELKDAALVSWIISPARRA